MGLGAERSEYFRHLEEHSSLGIRDPKQPVHSTNRLGGPGTLANIGADGRSRTPDIA
jgi:hypothetical protein